MIPEVITSELSIKWLPPAWNSYHGTTVNSPEQWSFPKLCFSGPVVLLTKTGGTISQLKMLSLSA